MTDPKALPNSPRLPERRQIPNQGPAVDSRAQGQNGRGTTTPAAPLEDLDESLTTPAEKWRDYFSKRRPAPQTVQRLVLKLHDAKEHEHVIAVIEAALIEGQSQPWMYEVLALSMELAGRPKAQIERVLLSLPDFTGQDFQSVTYAAAYLTRFGRDQQALQLLKQAAMLAPTRPEPYVLAVPLAKRLQDFDALRWSASGVLTYAWMKGYPKHHREAELALMEAERVLKERGEAADAEAMAKTLAEAKQRDLAIRVEWAGQGELDLTVEEPAGTVVSFQTPHSPAGGVLSHDGHGGNNGDAHDDYICAFAMPGTYTVKVNYVWGRIVGNRAKLTVVRYQGTPRETKSTAIVSLSQKDTIVRVKLEEGRRRKLTPVTQKDGVTSLIAPRRRGVPVRLVSASDDDYESRGARRRMDRNRMQVNPRVGFQPVVTTIPEGITNTALATVSGDRRYVRLTMTPLFSTITDVFTFSFASGGGGQAQGN